MICAVAFGDRREIIMKNRLCLGVARRIITPPVGCCLAGYAPDVIAEKVNDDLTVTALAFEQNGKKALLVSFTVLSIQTKLASELRRAIEKEFAPTVRFSRPLSFKTTCTTLRSRSRAPCRRVTITQACWCLRAPWSTAI